MRRMFLKYCSRTTLVCLETVAVVFVLLALFFGIFMWRLNSGPLDIGFAREYIEEALYDPDSAYNVKFGGLILHWPDLKGPLLLEISQVGLVSQEQQVVNIDTVKLGLSRSALLLGKIKPTSIYLSKPSLQLIRSVNNEIHMGLEQEGLGDVNNGEEGFDSPLERILESLSLPPGAPSEYHSAIDHLEMVEIEDARMVMEDHVMGITWFLPNLDLMFARDARGLATTASIDLPGGGRELPARIRANVIYSRQAEDFRANIYVENFDPRIVSRKVEALAFLDDHEVLIGGDIRIVADKKLSLHSVSIDVSAHEGLLSVPQVYEAPLPFETLELKASYDHPGGKFDVETLGIRTRGVSIGLASDMTITDKGMMASVRLSLPDLPQEKIAPLWPDALKGEPIEEWLTQKLSKGRMHNALLALDLVAEDNGQEWDVTIDNIVADFDIENMDVDYRAPLFPITNGYGSAHFADDVITITLDKAKLGDMEIEKGSVAIDHVISEGVGTVTVALDMAGPLKTLFDYVALEPIEMNDVIDAALRDKIAGRAVLSVGVSLPTSKDVKFEEVNVTVDGRLYDTVLPGIVRGLDVTGGPLALKVGDGQVSIGGDAFLGGRPVKASWMEYLESEGKPYTSQVTASFVADKGLRDHFGVDIDNWIDGSMPVKVVYTEYGGGKADAVVDADLKQVKVMAAPFNHVKPVGVAGKASCKVHIEKGMIQKLTGLTVQAQDMEMSSAELFFTSIDGESAVSAGKFPVFRLDETDMAVEFQFDSARVMNLTAKGPFLDARSFLGEKEKKKGPYDGPAFRASLDIERLRPHPNRLIDKAKIYLDMDKNGEMQQLEMDAIAGNGDIYFRLKPDDTGKLVLRFEAADAGATLRAFGIYENVKGGALTVYGESVSPEKKRVLTGNAEMNNFRLVNAPAIARLLSVISPAGLPQLVSSEGIHFSKLESGFTWRLRHDGDLYVVNKGRTSGSSLGLTFEGEIDKAKGQMEIKGHIVPVSMVNDFLGNIPLLGTILSGGSEGGVFAATYEIKGDIKKPETNVNPLSALAPGIIRRILFEE